MSILIIVCSRKLPKGNARSAPAVVTPLVAGRVGGTTPAVVAGVLSIVGLKVRVGFELQNLTLPGKIRLKELGNVLVGLKKSPSQDTGDGLVGLSEERSG